MTKNVTRQNFPPKSKVWINVVTGESGLRPQKKSLFNGGSLELRIAGSMKKINYIKRNKCVFYNYLGGEYTKATQII